jgi:hypothetical protein
MPDVSGMERTTVVTIIVITEPAELESALTALGLAAVPRMPGSVIVTSRPPMAGDEPTLPPPGEPRGRDQDSTMIDVSVEAEFAMAKREAAKERKRRERRRKIA